MISKELIGATSRPIILTILARQSSYGYAIIQRVKELSGGSMIWKDGMLYPVLHKLEDEKLISSSWDSSPGTRKRKYYSITPKGLRSLEKEKAAWRRVDDMLSAMWSLQGEVA